MVRSARLPTMSITPSPVALMFVVPLVPAIVRAIRAVLASVVLADAARTMVAASAAFVPQPASASSNIGKSPRTDRRRMITTVAAPVARQTSGGGSRLPRDLGGSGDHLVDEAVIERLLGREPAVAVGVLLDALDGLTGVEGDALGHHPLGVDDLLGVDNDVSGLGLGLGGK